LRGLTVYDLDINGEPTGKPRTYIYPYLSGAAFSRELVENIEIHPSKDLLYLSGFAVNGIYIYILDTNGEPTKKSIIIQ
jgi:hypothetical protein